MKKILLIVAFGILLAGCPLFRVHAASNQTLPVVSDNEYCLPGNIPQFGTADGPATLPQTCYYTARSATPSPNGVKWTVNSSTTLKAALAGASCGDVIQVTAGSVISGNFTYAKTCDPAHYITIETSDMGALPPEGTRISPCYAGVSSEPGYPNFNCVVANDAMAQIISPNSGAALTLGANASYLRVIGLELTRAIGAGVNYYIIGSGGAEADHIIFDQDYVHGDQKTDESTRGLSVTGMSYVGVIDSYFSDFWCISQTGACTDSQTVNGISSVIPQSTIKIVNNFLAASGETILFGGAGSSANEQTDIEIRGNWLFKPMTWYPNDPSYDGVNRIVKNLLEFKQGDRALVEGNTLQNVWTGYSQVGPALVLTPRENGVPPCCSDANLTIRYNYITHACQAFQTGSDSTTQGDSHVSIHDNVADDIGYNNLQGTDDCATTYSTQVFSPPHNASATAPPPSLTVLNNVTIKHNTIVTSGPGLAGLEVIDGPDAAAPPQVSGITWTDNLVDAGQYGFHLGIGGLDSCAAVAGASKNNATLINSCWVSSEFDYNVLVNGSSSGGGVWPGTHNAFPTTFSAVGFTNLNGGKGGNYQLLSASPYKGIADDGTDPGANITLVDAYTVNDLTGNEGTGGATTEPPIVTVTSPLANASLSGTVTLTASAVAQGSSVTSLQFEVDGTPVGSAIVTSPYSYSLNTATIANGIHTVTAEAKDVAGDIGLSMGVPVTVNNVATSSGSIFISTSSLNFGVVNVGTSSAAQRISLTNDTAQSVTMTNLVVSLPFSIATNYCVANATWNGSIAPNTHCDMYLEFTPQTSGAVAGSISASAGNYNFAVALSGTGVGGAATSTTGTTTVGEGSSGGGTGGGSGFIGVPATTAPVATTTVATSTTSNLESLLRSLISELQSLINQQNTLIVPQLGRNLTVGSAGSDVSLLQEFLDYNNYPVATSGTGSLGNEGNYFGPETSAALAKFQAANGLPGTGFFGPLTRQYIEQKW